MPKGAEMIRDTELSDLSQVSKFPWVDRGKIESHLKNKGKSLVFSREGVIDGFVCRIDAQKSIFLFNWSGKSKPRKQILLKVLEDLTIHRKCVINLHPNDQLGKKILRSHHFVLAYIHRGYEIWVHQYHPDNFYYRENPYDKRK